jgi:hypothetical protein
MFRGRLFFTGIALFLLVGAGVAWVLSNQGILQNSWASPFGIAFSVLGVLFTFVQWTLPLPSSETKVSVPSAESGDAQGMLYKQMYDRLTEENGALIIYEKRKNAGKNIRISSYSSSLSSTPLTFKPPYTPAIKINIWNSIATIKKVIESPLRALKKPGVPISSFFLKKLHMQN